ncbi:hypothetical protein [Nocardia aurea]|uniref:hypothetical protein n=1 Tax=Nocardia aurea TaxID=2144174 RepID=UPI0033BCABB7
MAEHRQMQPPHYHRCRDTILGSPAACHDLLTQLSAMTTAEANSPWSPWKGDEPPPYGHQVNEIVPAEVRLVALQVAYESLRESNQQMWQRLYDVMGVPPMQQSAFELVENVRRTVEQLNRRIAELDGCGPD